LSFQLAKGGFDVREFGGQTHLIDVPLEAPLDVDLVEDLVARNELKNEAEVFRLGIRELSTRCAISSLSCRRQAWMASGVELTSTGSGGAVSSAIFVTRSADTLVVLGLTSATTGTGLFGNNQWPSPIPTKAAAAAIASKVVSRMAKG